jgi:hypothetical protein
MRAWRSLPRQAPRTTASVAESRRLRRALPVVLTWSLLAAVGLSVTAWAAASAPVGRVFVGTFYFVDDFYNYLSYAQQAEDGALVFRNKLASPTSVPALVNLEWLAVGWLSALLGREPIVAYRLFGLLASLAFVALADRWLLRSGLAPPSRLAALLLVCTGGSFGALLYAAGWLPGERAWDLRAGLYPFVEILANPHFVAGTTLLLAALGELAARRTLRAVFLGTALGLVRPYDAALLAGVGTAAVLLQDPPGLWVRRLAPIVGLAPVLAYNAWVLLASPGYRAFSSARYWTNSPTLAELALALGPPALLALTVVRLPPGESGEGRHRLFLALWAALAVALGVLRSVSFSFQFLVGSGAPLLALSAVGLSRRRRGLLEGAVLLLGGTAAVATYTVTRSSPRWHVPAAHWRAAAALRTVCRPGEVVLASADIGLVAGGLTSCWPLVSHAAAPDYEARLAAANRFYASESPEERARLLDGACASHAVVPLTAGGAPVDSGPSFRAAAIARADGFAILSRRLSRPCPPPGASGSP